MGKGFEWVLAMDGTPERTWLAIAGMHLEVALGMHLEVALGSAATTSVARDVRVPSHPNPL